MRMYNPVLGITSDDIINCNDIVQLRQWKMSIAVQRTDILFDNGVRKENELQNQDRKKMLFLRRMETLIYRRMAELSREYNLGRKESIAVAFMDASERILPKWQFDLIMERSKEDGNTERMGKAIV